MVVFILPGNVLPEGTAAGVYMQAPAQNQFRLLGALANEKPSAIFKVTLPEASNVDSQVVNLGISVEPAASIQGQLLQLQADNPISTAIVKRPPSTKVLAQRIIKNAFNFLASFGGQIGGQEVVPLRSFQDWWTKFERRIENDPSFLERDEEG